MDFSAPPPPDSAEALLPKEADSFGEGLWNVVRAALETAAPSLTEAAKCCVRAFAAVLIVAVTAQFSGNLPAQALEVAGTAAVGTLLLQPSGTLMTLGIQTVKELRDYGRLLLPVMASALAAKGGVTASGALYAGTAVFDTVLSSAAEAALVPLIGMFLAVSIAYGAAGEPLIGKIRDLIRWGMEWVLKLTLYVFTGYLTVTGVVSGAADAAAGKAARIAVSGAVPVVGGILADATDAVLTSAAALGSGAGIWGILAVLAVFSVPAFRIGAQYLMLKLCAGIAGSLGGFRCAELIGDFAAAMGLLLAMVSTQAVLLMISTVCFLRGIGG